MSPRLFDRAGSPSVNRRQMLGGTLLAGLSGPLVVLTADAPQPAFAGDAPDASNERKASKQAKTLLKTIEARPYGADQDEAILGALAASGIAVYETPTDTTPLVALTGPASPLRLLHWQARSMALELAAGGGMTGAELDALIVPVDGAPTPSVLIAAWAAAIDSPGADLARAVLGQKAWKRAEKRRFPALITTLFVADLTVDVAAVSASAGGPRALLDNSGCFGVTGFIDKVIDGVFNALKIEVKDDQPGATIASIWNFLVDLGDTIVKGIVETLLTPVLKVIQAIAGVVAVAGMVVSILQPARVMVTLSPAKTSFGIAPAAGNPGTIEARVDTVVDDWPDWLVECASDGNVTLPPLIPKNAPINWEISQEPDGLIVIHDPEPAKLDAKADAVINYVTATEDKATAKGTEQKGTVTVNPDVPRDDFKTVIDTLTDLVFSTLPAAVGDALKGVLKPQIDHFLPELTKSLDIASDKQTLTVIYHTKPEPTSAPEETAGTETGDTSAGCPYGAWKIVNWIDSLNSFVNNAGQPVTYSAESGDSIMTFGEDGSFSWQFIGYQLVGSEIDPNVGQIDEQLYFDGTVSASFTVNGNGLITFSGADFSGFSLSFDSYVAGTFLGNTPIDPALFGLLDGSGYTPTCTKAGMDLLPNIVATVPIHLAAAS